MKASARLMSSAVQLLKSGKIHDDVNKGILYINFNSHAAKMEYERDGDLYDLVHTSIPDEYQGQGLGSVFAERIFDYLIERDKKIKLTCEFLESFYSRNIHKYKNSVVSE